MKSFCSNCGNKAKYKKVYPVDDHLSKQWLLSKSYTTLFNKREGLICSSCGVNRRAQGLASAILRSRFGYNESNLRDWVAVANKNKLKVCELNSCHNLHETLRGLNNLTYAEYGTNSQEDIENLSYSKNQFDIVLHSETLEHINNPEIAMDECRRVITERGVVLFTIPIIWNRLTNRRTRLDDKKITYIMPASYHGYMKDDYLVYFEFGNDAPNKLKSNIVVKDWLNQNYVHSSTKKGISMSKFNNYVMRKLEKTAVLKEEVFNHEN